MATCRCSMCGGKNATKRKCKNRRLYHEHNVGRDEHNRSWDYGSDRDSERRLLRRRMKQSLRKVIAEQTD